MSAGTDTLYYRLALARARDGNLTEAIAFARTALALNGGNERARKLLEICSYETGYPYTDSKTPHKGSSASPEASAGADDINILLNNLKSKDGRLNARKAEALLKTLPRQSVRVLNMRGCLAAMRGRYGDAARFFVMALEKDRGDRLAASGLAEAVRRRRKGIWGK